MPAVTLKNRALIAITGDEAEHFLQNLITTDITAIQIGEFWPGALLTPQGKLLFDFLIGRTEASFVLETSNDTVDPLIRRLTLYRLRAKVNFERQEGEEITVSWNGTLSREGLIDHRFALTGISLSRVAGNLGTDDPSLYNLLRMKQGISGGGEDKDIGDYFPHDLLMDKNGGLSFKKGCYVGQEVVSRMQHRSTARRRIVSVTAEKALAQAGSIFTVEGRDIGSLIAREGAFGLGVIRIDKAGTAMAEGQSVLLGEQPVSITLPHWTGLQFPTEANETSA